MKKIKESLIQKSAGSSVINLLLASSVTILQRGLCELLSEEKDFVIVKETFNEEDTIRYAEKMKPDVILFCFNHRLENCCKLVAKIKKKTKKSRLILFNYYNFKQRDELKLVRDGVAGILKNDCDPKVVTEAIRKVHGGDFWLRRELISSLINALHIVPPKTEYFGNDKIPLSKREFDVLIEVASGCDNNEISFKLCISKTTVKTHINNIYKKLKIRDRQQATLFAMKHKIISSFA